ncbi:hypothetical protein A3D08_01340 [Candidatus Roizmanbacteria bacterium RIFCSPHIGHO2_02_FULL_43_11]|uniref:Mannosyl-glycoprotein endo-beta-N-acetylglucosamidase-like domain-containing protein n=1 Tax=Candidatus Roizmanbacteria bacterium RIFCSPHIGHO2_02_FULL_43_11 TaxID=1802043 RepID=A0A1F7HLH5_9BACT|nr:MAG: hypothetical protein A3D08_01340 [Candidatus Roizmanbacteria bacterium RIFCSPHIGHO2_02_FULL_43_11]
MKKLTQIFIIAVAFYLFGVIAPAYGYEKTADSSARIFEVSQLRGGSEEAGLMSQNDNYLPALAIRVVLHRYGSPLAQEAEYFVYAARKNSLEPYMLPAIAGVESGFGQALIRDSYNPFGWGGGRIYFDSWKHGISIVGEALHTRYIMRGAQSVHDIGPRYAGGSQTWAPKVLAYIHAFEEEETRLRRLSVL